MKKMLSLVVLVFLAIILYYNFNYFLPRLNAEENLLWMAWGDEAKNKAQSENKMILIDVYATWCGPCKMMDSDTYSNPDVQNVLKDFILVKIDVDANPDAATEFSEGAIPTTTILNSKGEKMASQVGYLPPANFLSFVQEAKAKT